VFRFLLWAILAALKPKALVVAENLCLRQQLLVLQRRQPRPYLKRADSRRHFYDWLAQNIIIDGIKNVQRDKVFDNKDFFSGGIRLFYDNVTEPIKDLKDGVLLEDGFDDVTPNVPKDITSWAYDHAARKADIIDNRASADLSPN
jgi:hypothetical protein